MNLSKKDQQAMDQLRKQVQKRLEERRRKYPSRYSLDPEQFKQAIKKDSTRLPDFEIQLKPPISQPEE